MGGRTYQDYLNILRLHVRPVLGKKRLSTLRPLEIQDLVDRMQGKGLSPRTVRFRQGRGETIIKEASNSKGMA